MKEGKRGTPGGAHNLRDVVPFEEFLAGELKRRAEWAARPENVARERERQEWAEKRKLQRAVGKAKANAIDVIGPPNPYKPHRKWRPPED